LTRDLQEAERRISALLATRGGNSELASLHTQIADMLLALSKQDELMGKAKKSKRQKAVERVHKLEARIEELTATAAAMKEVI